MTPLPRIVNVNDYLDYITNRIVPDFDREIRAALEGPDEIRQSRTDTEILLFYKTEGTSRWVCAVAKHARDQAFLITAYPTDAIKKGIRVWPS